jgi:lipopolysaccharide export system protein LptA
MFRRASCALLLALAPVLAAQSPPNVAAPRGGTELRLRGPIKITAERAELEKREMALYRGNVRLTSPELTLTGERLELRQPAKGQFEAKVDGRPARLTHKGEGDIPAVSASAAQIHYDTRSAMVDLSGGAQLERGADVLTSDRIRYDLAQRRISASGIGPGQVQIVIQPPNGDAGKSPPPPKPDAAPATPGAPP